MNETILSSRSDSDWYAPLRALRSLGSLDEGPGSLAGLHEARKRHIGQFFTPIEVARFMWEIAKQAMPEGVDPAVPRRYSVLDNSVGSGSLLQFCDPARHFVGGLDIHRPTIARVQEVFEAAGFKCEFDVGSMEGARPKGFDLALVNPPFSIHFESPLLKKYPSNSFGKYGPGTSARSDRYALAQALDAADVVVALLPQSIAQWAASSLEDAKGVRERWVATYFLPTGSFRAEGAEVEVAICVFDAKGRTVVRKPGACGIHRVADLSDVPVLDLAVLASMGAARIGWKHLDDAQPTITLPVTGDKTVRIAHDGRKLVLGFKCGFTEARVRNAVLDAPNWGEDGQRLPKQYPYTGSARLDLEAHIATGDAMRSFNELLELIEGAEATVDVAPGVREHLKRRELRSKRQATPFAHVVWDQLGGDDGAIKAKARKSVLADTSSWKGWVIKKDEEVEFTPVDGGAYEARKGELVCRRTIDEIHRDFVATSVQVAEGWCEVHAGLLKAYPDLAHERRARMRALGIDQWMNWEFQQEDLVECLLKPVGGVAGWSMALGKSRLATGMVLLSGVRHGLLAMDAYLVPEFAGKLAALPIDADEWQAIDSPAQLTTLKRINLISYERLRMKLPGRKTQTYAHKLRRRIGLLVADEGELLANPLSEQSVALARVAAKRKFCLTGTPCPNYPRDLLPIIAFTGGDGTAAQPFGFRGPYMEPRLVTSAACARRGVDQFRENFVTLEWVTDAFLEDMRGGAKREVPKINNLPAYRAALAPHIKRRIPQEPLVAKDVQIPVPNRQEPHVLSFDDEHLGFYLKVADDFAQWWGQSKGGQQPTPGDSTRRVNPLMMLLVRIGAVVRANNIPQRFGNGGEFVWRGGLTSKQRFAIERLQELVEAKEKVLLFCHNPETVELLHRELAKQGIDSVRAHGGIPIAKRYSDIQKGFRHGGTPLMLATTGVAQAGMDLPEASRVVYYDRDWASKVEDQALARALRPQTAHDVVAEWIHLEGSIDEYMAQMVDFKRDCFKAGVDWCTPELADSEFLHMDTIVGRFVEGLAEMQGLRSFELRDKLKLLAA